MFPGFRPLGAPAASLALALAACGGSPSSAPAGGPPLPAPCTTPADCPGADTTCSVRTCTGGTCGVEYAVARTPCAEGGGRLCDGAGSCAECLAEADCPTPANECQYATCVAHACGTAVYAPGTPVAAQIPGDCLRVECDPEGNTTIKSYAADEPASTPCHDGICTLFDGVETPEQMPLPEGTPCSDPLGAAGTCDASQVCVVPPP